MRDLGPEDVIRDTDEMSGDDGKRWIRVYGFIVGQKVKKYPSWKFRRP